MSRYTAKPVKHVLPERQQDEDRKQKCFCMMWASQWKRLPDETLPESEDGNKFVLVVIDCFSKWMEAYAVLNMEAKTIEEKLIMEFISCFAVPVQVKSDRGKQFDCELFRYMCQLLDIDHKMSTPVLPRVTPEWKEWSRSWETWLLSSVKLTGNGTKTGPS